MPWRRIVVALLSLCLGLFVADAIVSLLDDTLILLFDVHFLAAIRGIVGFLALLIALAIYGLMALTPIVPKRLFLPLTLFYPLVALASVPFWVYWHGRIQQVSWAISLSQVILGLIILFKARGASGFAWPLVPDELLGARGFTWLNLAGFVSVNLFVFVPAAAAYLVLCAALAASHFSEGFLALRPGGLTVQMRKYVRADGKTIQLFPMAHIGEADFYQKIAHSFPTNAIILEEGVSDDQNLLTNRITYKRMATTLGLSEQVKEFKPTQGKQVRADVDVDVFGTNTIAFLNLAMLIHTRGLNAEVLTALMQYSPPAGLDEQLLEDLLRKRNHHLLQEIQSRLAESEILVVPWGVAHMPEVAREIQKSGFRLEQTQEYVVIRFGSAGDRSK
jgi:hypothetical protein